MRYTRRLGLFISAIILALGTIVATAVDTSAQVRGRIIYRPVIVRHHHFGFDPFWRSSLWYDPYWSDPYLAHEREKYYVENNVKNERNDLAKAREKYGADGVITAKEQKKLDKAVREYNKAVERRDRFDRDSD